MAPQTIGRYSILRELGHGAMGVVYEAEDPNIGRRIALKVVRTDQIGANRDEVLRRFKNEAKAAGNLSHPNIITIHDAGEHEGLLYIAMEFVEGTNLAEMIAKQGRMPPTKVVDITRQVCAGLDFAHTRGIIHRDVKPANIMLTDSLVKITDFGIANVGDGMTITGTVVGTPNYMSPEQVLGKPLDGRSDLFSVGVMLYEMITGERPFEGQSITTIMYKIVHEEPIAPRKLDSTIHPGLSAIIERALAKSPEGRFQRGSELSGALERYQQIGISSATLSGNEPTAALPALPETAPLTQPNFRTDSIATRTEQTAYQTIQQPPATVVAETNKKRGFSPVLLGCFGVMALGIIAVLILSLVAMLYKKDKPPRRNATVAQQSENEEAPAPPPPGAGAAAVAPTTNAHVVEKAPAKPAQKKATLKLNSSPPGADILVDGKSTGKETPDTVSVDKGEHTIAIRMEGFKDASAKFKVSGGEEFEFAPELTPAGTAMNIPMPNIAVPDVRQMLGPNSETMRNMQALRKSPGLSPSQRAEIDNWAKWGEMQKTGTPNILVNSHPQGARVIIDGKDSGKTTPDVLPTSNGRHTVRFELPGYEPFEREIEVGGSNRGPAMINIRFHPQAPKPPASPDQPH